MNQYFSSTAVLQTQTYTEMPQLIDGLNLYISD